MIDEVAAQRRADKYVVDCARFCECRAFGSTTTYGLSWLVLLVIPMVEAISAQVGVVTNTGLESVVRKRYSFPFMQP
jgi:hypothetical protein